MTIEKPIPIAKYNCYEKSLFAPMLIVIRTVHFVLTIKDPPNGYTYHESCY